MSLSRRNAASESAKKAVARGSWFVARKSAPSFRMGCGQISQRAALWDGPYEPQTHSPRATSHELRTTKKALEFSSAFFTRISDFLSSQGASPQVLSAFAGLTAVFGMGTGGSPQLSPLNCYVIQDSYPDNCIKMFFLTGRPLPFGRILCLSQVLGLLVPVRSVHRCTSTPGLSTTSSLWDLTC